LALQGGRMRDKRTQEWSAEEKLAAILEYERLSQEERGKFLRGKGLHEAHLEKWKKEIIEGLKTKPFAGGKNDPKQKRIAALEKELRRKESALAEAAALLVLKKKADAIWGKDEVGK
jgi:transposase